VVVVEGIMVTAAVGVEGEEGSSAVAGAALVSTAEVAVAGVAGPGRGDDSQVEEAEGEEGTTTKGTATAVTEGAGGTTGIAVTKVRPSTPVRRVAAELERGREPREAGTGTGTGAWIEIEIETEPETETGIKTGPETETGIKTGSEPTALGATAVGMPGTLETPEIATETEEGTAEIEVKRNALGRIHA
jgi:hypothetical protein